MKHSQGTEVTLGLIGAGHFGAVLARGCIAQGVVLPSKLHIFQRSQERADNLKKELGCSVYTEGNYDALRHCSVIVIAVRPQDFRALSPLISTHLNPEQIVISVMAGVSLPVIASALPHVTKFVRAMPNLPAKIGRGITAYATQGISQEELAWVDYFFKGYGETIPLSSESSLDGATAVSGSGPGYVFSFLNGFVSGARNVGFTQQEAELLVHKTVEGCLALWTEERLPLETLRDRVKSPGGTTEAGLNVMERGNFESLIVHAIGAAMQRAQELRVLCNNI
jgi:pyrroline-5-carboxylate reductase